MNTMKIQVAVHARPVIEKTVARLERMHQRRGLLFAATWGEQYGRRKNIRSMGGTNQQAHERQGKTGVFYYNDLTLMMNPLSDEWDLLYTVSPANPDEPHGSEAIIKQNPLSDEQHDYPTHFHDHCDHCTSGRRGRHNTMTFRHKTRDEIVSVGSSCVLEYTGIDPALIESILEFKGKATTHNYDTGGSGGITTMSSYEFALRGALWLHASKPYQKGLGQALFFNELIKDGKTGQIGFGYEQLVPRAIIIQAPVGGVTEPVGFRWLYSDDEDATAPEAISPSVFTMANDFHAYCENLSGSSSFEHSVRNIYKSGVVTKKSAAMAGGALAGYIKAKKRATQEAAKKEQEANAPDTHHIGNSGDRMTFSQATVVFTRQINGYYGTSTLTKLSTTHEGKSAVLVWFRSGDKSDLQVGDIVSDLTATVKKHDEYKGEKQTVVTRGKFTLGGRGV